MLYFSTSQLIELVSMKVNRVIHPADGMYREGRESEYFGVGQSAINCIRLALLANSKTSDDVQSILDLPCGYGRVLRMLQAEFPNADLFACDINRGAVDFCAREFDTFPVYSSNPISAVKLDTSFDLIWCGSLLTHLDPHGWNNFITFFHRHLTSEGCLIFTTHGREALRRLRHGTFFHPQMLTDEYKDRFLASYEEGGIAYIDYPWMQGYGISFSSCSWVLRFLERSFSSTRTRVIYLERGWAGVQDVYICYAPLSPKA